ncbi:GDSL family lipase [Mucilaginibacter sp. PAMC 26640]|nr:GDSL family lipase [Mucilaginibacter sp. PAMC 26640]
MQWYEDDIKRLEEKSLAENYTAETIFYGSSSIRVWNTLEKDLAEFHPVNLGFGGSTLASCTWFFDRVMANYQPKRLVVYAGDNDLGDGRRPEEVCLFFEELMQKAKQRFGDIPCYFISAKPSIARWNIVDNFKYANELIEREIVNLNANWHFIDIFPKMLDINGKPDPKFYIEDGLHLSAAGYQIWTEAVKTAIGDNG